MLTLESLTTRAIDDFTSEIQKWKTTQELLEMIYELSNRYVPTHYSDLVRFAYDNQQFLFDEPEIDPFGNNSPIHLIQANIQDHIANELHQVLWEYEEAQQCETMPKGHKV